MEVPTRLYAICFTQSQFSRCFVLFSFCWIPRTSLVVNPLDTHPTCSSCSTGLPVSGYSKASDVYSFGMVLWEMIANRVPFHDFTAFQVMAQAPWLPAPFFCWLLLQLVLFLVVFSFKKCKKSLKDERTMWEDVNDRQRHGVLYASHKFLSHKSRTQMKTNQSKLLLCLKETLVFTRFQDFWWLRAFPFSPELFTIRTLVSPVLGGLRSEAPRAAWDLPVELLVDGGRWGGSRSGRLGRGLGAGFEVWVGFGFGWLGWFGSGELPRLARYPTKLTFAAWYAVV